MTTRKTTVNTLAGVFGCFLPRHEPYPSFKVDKYIRRYLVEAQYRFNRRYDLKAILARLLHAVIFTGPQPRARQSRG